MYDEKYLENLNRDLIDKGIWSNVQVKLFSKYFYGLSYNQLEILTEELIKVNSEIGLDMDELIYSYEEFKELSKKYNSDAKVSVSYYVNNYYVGLSFPYNERYSNMLKSYGEYDKKNKGYLINPYIIEEVLDKLDDMDADCSNCIDQLKNDILPILGERVKYNKSLEKERIKKEQDEERNRLTFIGKSNTNSYGHFQFAQKIVSEEDAKIYKMKKEKTKEERKRKLKNFIRLFKINISK